jgi:membrane-bound lytic murein transglycosylase D
MIQRVMAEEGVPQDLIYLAVAESGFSRGLSIAGSKAGGMWQFMPLGNYGLARNAYVDERFDPEKSTRAYARYMKFIYDQLGDWYLSMAGYDWGAGNVQRAVRKNRLRRFLGAVQAQQSAQRDKATTCPRFWRPSSSPIIPRSMASTM